VLNNLHCCIRVAAKGVALVYNGLRGSNELSMTFLRTIRCVRLWLLAFFVLAQVAGVVPLIYDHTLNVYETVPVSAHAHAHVKPTITEPDADHHHGFLDLHDQCCALHTLSGPLPHVADAAPVHFAGVLIVPEQPVALIGTDPASLDRPPRPLPLS
jgi:hypothetical protein